MADMDVDDTPAPSGGSKVKKEAKDDGKKRFEVKKVREIVIVGLASLVQARACYKEL
jgi:hypothetical protein